MVQAVHPTDLRRLEQGRGQGEGADYRPWIEVSEVPSLGTSGRRQGWLSTRVHHLLSRLEVHYFLQLDWPRSAARDIREQYPLLPLEETLAIAADCGFVHPADPRTKEPRVMTSDFRLVLAGGEAVRSTKYAVDLGNERVLEKLEIERRYWQRRQVSWALVTEREIIPQLVGNLQRLRRHRQLDDLADLAPGDLPRAERLLTPAALAGRLPLRTLTADCDERLLLTPGTSLAVAWHLLACGYWRADLTADLIEPQRPLTLLGLDPERLVFPDDATDNQCLMGSA